MEIKNNVVFAKEGKQLKTILGIMPSIQLGNHIQIINDEVIQHTINLADIKEVSPIFVEGNLIYVESSDYNSIVTELIRSKFSLDEELALYANYRIGKDFDKEQLFQDWRQSCKAAAKRFINE